MQEPLSINGEEERLKVQKDACWTERGGKKGQSLSDTGLIYEHFPSHHPIKKKASLQKIETVGSSKEKK